MAHLCFSSLVLHRPKYVPLTEPANQICQPSVVLHRLSKPIACIKDLPSSTFSPHELVLSDHSQVFPSTQILDKVVVRVFNESIAEQPVIAPDEWWYRYFWPTKQKRFLTAGHTNLPQPQCAMRTACVKKGYTPHSGLQHYCPRNSCRRWYHQACLSGHEFQPNPGDTNERLILMLRGTPGFEWIDLTEDGRDTKFFEHLKLCLDFIKGIVACAQHGVMRGKGYGVVGNINAVKRARELLVEARESDLWPSDAEIKEFVKWKFPEGKLYPSLLITTPYAMFAKISAVLLVLSAAASVSAHGVLVAVNGANGVKAQGFGVVESTPRDGTRRNPFQTDSSIIRDKEIASGDADACGRTLAGGVNNMAAMLEAASSAGLPSVAADGTVSMTLHQVNGDGAG
ncbi:hypothetical protein FRC06_010109 [Ceratobasidium sp. 370]|nr:hypothetical protein FRC06_010109 [Ceratobasidium sp. 370]